MYTVIGGVRSRTLRVLWMLEELGQSYTHHAAAPRSPEVTSIYAAGKIPVLLDGDTAITDSTAILTYLTDKHGSFTHPAGTLKRAQQDAHTNFILDEMDAVLWAAARHSFVLPEDKRVPELKESLKWEYTISLDRLEQRLGDGPYLMGDMISVPDIIAAHCAGWAGNAGFPAPSPKLQKYVDDLRSRDAFIRALKH